MDGAEQIDIGELTIDAAFLAGRFALSPDALRRHMKRGLVRCVVERGEDEDAGRTRLSVRIGNRTWIAVIASDGAVVSERMAHAPAHLPAGSRRS
ncbi:hypothetical protein CO662_34380 [Rhizobium anhuiense]|jgi:hypothetical protein|uniref:DUF4258 domain-containing protein n=1 Tax=Rhizobium anhuiense TaxID=1184720 RepID=A0ABX4IZ57_9HYPH|nr:DUF6522 family protein [Rhizobium anhuiense]PDS40594.1 hypothetical protein CO668_33385 [Rhizobium anhuiense]PDS47506.1 hypothetical protein CO662_34380 [Rhizobium anhuiense]